MPSTGSPWAYDSLTGPATAAILHPGSDRVILFHVVASGRCWVAVGDGPRHWASAGDVIVLPYGDQHRMGGVSEAEPVSITTFLDNPPWTQMPVLRHGGADGNLTDVVCGYLQSHDSLFDPDLRVFPPVFVVRPPDGTAADWVRANIAFALQQTSASPPAPDPGATRLPELLLVEVLRLHLATAPVLDQGWAAALGDPVVRPALALLHRSPAHKWTVPELAAATAVSRSQLDSRFRDGARALADPLPHRVADAPCAGPAREHRPRSGGGGTAGRLRRRGGVQPGLQAGLRLRTRRLATGAVPALRLTGRRAAGDASSRGRRRRSPGSR